MTDFDVLIAVCIPSIGRESVLDTVRSVLDQELPPKTKLQIIIADDSKVGAVIPSLGLLANDGRVSVVNCAQANIAAARNCTLRFVGDAAFIAFIDDDEIADRDWLKFLLEEAEREKADVVFGPVEPIFSDGCPDWADQAGLFRKRPADQRRPLRTGATSNVLIRNSPAVQQARFDLRLGVTGGEDTLYFSELYKLGLKLTGSSKGLVRENVTANRLELNSIRSRYMRGGQTSAVIHHDRQGFVIRSVLFLRSGMKAGLFGAFSLLPSSKGSRIRHRLRYWSALGEMRNSLGFPMQQIYSSNSKNENSSESIIDI